MALLLPLMLWFVTLTYCQMWIGSLYLVTSTWPILPITWAHRTPAYAVSRSPVRVIELGSHHRSGDGMVYLIGTSMPTDPTCCIRGKERTPCSPIACAILGMPRHAPTPQT